MRFLPSLPLLLVLLVALGGIASSHRLVRRDPGMSLDAKAPPTCGAGDMGEAESGVSAYGKISSEGEAFTRCCDQHLRCYCTCDGNISKQMCDETFRQCLQRGCIDKLDNKGHFEMRRCSTGWSWSGPGMVNSQVANSVEFSCERYDEVQATCCSP
ncbi:hypothetical protein K493DRAFT_313854 [Basidiobolus meristosporus CBS 931.73]|uniref:Uncharacterized protein n=1 Tax=Basidiobolus meristosporus CBS 931.73 TaxID=1314790 RepID=A0A1Y1YJ73_9FUNG|nr:hypothetical protein K493DRAFT_313854 [Basidiobolus meristosporus CBS 931.73]|eukprot:ORX97998.1 hypothetical protein K493DRAFT_313854 [Basidiobolus meristosporus CBS 931.73]